MRAISEALGVSWETAFAGICVFALMMHDMPESDAVWGQYLRSRGWRRYIVPCADEPCTVEQFCDEHPEGVYVVSVHHHVICIRDGCCIDTWDSRGEYPIYYWKKER
ncbi:MAG: hypothetical protein IJ302_01680 [Clostridia bacterium]|nr:hypothetical protein [Clostridia bacterium]